jgi:hypothetical protein
MVVLVVVFIGFWCAKWGWVRFVVCGFHERVLDGWDGMAFDTPILISFNNSLSFDYPEAASFVWPVVFISF